jgi:hypothetical protein
LHHCAQMGSSVRNFFDGGLLFSMVRKYPTGQDWFLKIVKILLAEDLSILEQQAEASRSLGKCWQGQEGPKFLAPRVLRTGIRYRLLMLFRLRPLTKPASSVFLSFLKLRSTQNTSPFAETRGYNHAQYRNVGLGARCVEQRATTKSCVSKRSFPFIFPDKGRRWSTPPALR